MPYDPTIPLLGIYPDKTIIWNNTCTPRWMDKEGVVCIHTHTHIDTHTMKYYSAIKKNKIIAATWMHLEIIILRSVRKRKINIIYHLYLESKIWHKWTYLWTKNRLTNIENRLVASNGEMGQQRGGLGVWD